MQKRLTPIYVGWIDCFFNPYLLEKKDYPLLGLVSTRSPVFCTVFSVFVSEWSYWSGLWAFFWRKGNSEIKKWTGSFKSWVKVNRSLLGLALTALGKDKANTEKTTTKLTALNRVFFDIMCLLYMRALNRDDKKRGRTQSKSLRIDYSRHLSLQGTFFNLAFFLMFVKFDIKLTPLKTTR